MIVTVNGRDYAASERVVRIVMWLLRNDRRVSHIERGKLLFMLNGPKISADLTECETVPQ